MKKEKKLSEFIDSLDPKIRIVISQIIQAEGEGQYKIKQRIRQIIEKEAQNRET